MGQWVFHRAIARNPQQTVTRKSLARQIAQLAKAGDIIAAERLCVYGKRLSSNESFLSLYYNALDELGASMRGKAITRPYLRGEHPTQVTEKRLAELKRDYASQRETIIAIFMDAVDRHDGKTIMELAQAVWFFKDKRLPHRVSEDGERETLVLLKSILDRSGEKITVRTLWNFLTLEARMTAKHRGEKLEAPTDGFSALRRKCKAMNFPLAEAKKKKR